MKKQVLMILAVFVFYPHLLSARDFHLKFIEENYKETRTAFSYHPLIYHSVQVDSTAGPKMLVLTGDNQQYRSWIRYYIAQEKAFILKVPDGQADQFIASKLFKSDIQSLHPYDSDKWQKAAPVKTGEKTMLEGEMVLLLVDTNDVRANLFKTVAKKMGYDAVSFKSGEDAISVFQTQPDKIKLVAFSHQVPDIETSIFVERIMALKHTTPVIVNTGYGHDDLNERFKAMFLKFKSVQVKSVLLNDLENTIKQIFHSEV